MKQYTHLPVFKPAVGHDSSKRPSIDGASRSDIPQSVDVSWLTNCAAKIGMRRQMLLMVPLDEPVEHLAEQKSACQRQAIVESSESRIVI